MVLLCFMGVVGTVVCGRVVVVVWQGGSGGTAEWYGGDGGGQSGDGWWNDGSGRVERGNVGRWQGGQMA